MAVRSCFLAIFLLAFSGFSTKIHAQPYDILIKNARVLDGTGNPWFFADVAVSDDLIVAIGDLKRAEAEFEIDATGLYLTPGFIDSHSHAAGGLTAKDRSPATPLLAQGITTVIVNPDGGGPVNLPKQRKDLLRHGLGINVMQLISHGSVRRQIMGMANRAPDKAELEGMKALVRAGMNAGAWGLSCGPFYAPGSFADTQELIELARVTASFNGVYTSHIRDESNYSIGVVAAVDEVIEIAREADIPGIVTHIKALGPPVWGLSETVVQHIERARLEGIQVYADQYPYEASATSLAAALVPRWAVAGGNDSLFIRLADETTAKKIREGIVKNLARRGGADRIQFRFYVPDRTVEGRTLADVASDWEMDHIETTIKMVKAGDAGIVSFNMDENDVATFMRQRWTMTSSDGSFPSWGYGVPHPRAFGSFPRKIRKYVIEEQVVDLAEAIRSMTSLPAQVFGITNRGTIRPNAIADLVLFDLDQIRDLATFTEPYQQAEGVAFVIVNGQIAFEAGESTDRMAGQVLLRPHP